MATVLGPGIVGATRYRLEMHSLESTQYKVVFDVLFAGEMIKCGGNTSWKYLTSFLKICSHS
jgi:hypothetical protein